MLLLLMTGMSYSILQGRGINGTGEFHQPKSYNEWEVHKPNSRTDCASPNSNSDKNFQCFPPILIMVRIVNLINTFASTYSILMILSNFSRFCSYCLLSKMEKLSSRGLALEHLESSGTLVLMNGPNIRNLCTGRKRELNMDP